jgi:UDP-N-acetylmuramate dehydrogenase
MRFSYRSSSVDENIAVLSVTFRFQHKDKSLILSDMNGAIRRKRAEQPTNMPSAGSVFRRTAGEPPAILIDRAGLKGMSVGGAAVSEKHSGFIVNTKNAKSADVRLLIDKIKHIIMDKYAQPLECEVELLEE